MNVPPENATIYGAEGGIGVAREKLEVGASRE
jgi:hypothetical protein